MIKEKGYGKLKIDKLINYKEHMGSRKLSLKIIK